MVHIRETGRSVNIFKDKGFIETEVLCLNPIFIKDSFIHFIHTTNVYKERFLQKYYPHGFDGYSYLGQKDSTNQYEFDLLHSFVLSNLHRIDSFPAEFHAYLKNEWNMCLELVRSIEQDIISALGIPELLKFYSNCFGHMASCNYYPSASELNFQAPSRLSMHVDVSLFTVFVYGHDDDFRLLHNNMERSLPCRRNIKVFPGYFLEYLTNGEIKALNHYVRNSSSEQDDRFSCALFSLPLPKMIFSYRGKEFSSEEYFECYLNLF